MSATTFSNSCKPVAIAASLTGMTRIERASRSCVLSVGGVPRPDQLDDRAVRTLERLTREGRWIHDARRVTRDEAPVTFVSVQTLAAIAIGTDPTFGEVRDQLGITKNQLSRALKDLRGAGLISEPPRRYTRDVLPLITPDGTALLETLVRRLDAP